jgi:multisubunit Na+/H+ antiporter MnhE subunit
MSRAGPVGRWMAGAWLLLLFLRAVAVSGVQTMAIIVRRACGGPSPRAGLVRMRFAPMSENGATLMGCLITLTPGTTTIDIDMERREMLLHLLDLEGAEDAVAGIRREFEPSVVRIFGRDGDEGGPR